MANASAELTAVVGVKNKCLKHVRRFVESIYQQKMPIKLVLVDYGSDKRHFGQIQRLAWYSMRLVTLVEVTRNTERWNEGRALNIGIKRVETPYLFTTNADLILAPDFAETVLRELREDSRAFVLCLQRLDLDAGGDSQGMSPSCYYGTCMGTPTEWFHKAHGFDERYEGWGRMDMDLANRARNDGRIWKDISSLTLAKHQYHKHIKPIGDTSWKQEAKERNNRIFKEGGPIIRNPDGWGEL
jgi:GT2 family glycosyltransferase